MADEIVDIIHRLSYEVKDDNLKTVTQTLSDQLTRFDKINKEIERYKELMNQANAANQTASANAYQKVIENQANAQKILNEQIQNTLRNNKELQAAIDREMSLIGSLTDRIKRLKQEREGAMSEEAIAKYNQQIKAAEESLRRFMTLGNQTPPANNGILARLFGANPVQQLGQGLLAGLGVGTGFGIITKLTSEVTELLGKAEELGKKAEGIEPAFARLDRPGLLNELREATKGTVSDLDLMRRAVSANNFQIPLERLGTLLQFARTRARETGQDVDYLVNSIVLGIGQQSVKRIDNLGISAHRVREEFQKTGDFAAAAFNVINEEVEKSSATLSGYADLIDQIEARRTNMLTKVGQDLNGMKGVLLDAGRDVFRLFTDDEFFNKPTLGEEFVQSLKARKDLINYQNDVNQQSGALYFQNFKQYEDQFVKADFDSRKQIEKQASDMYSALVKSAQEWQAQGKSLDATYFDGLKQAYQSLQKYFEGNPIGLKQLKAADLPKLTTEQLEDTKKQISDAFNPLTRTGAADEKQLAALRKLDDEVQKELDARYGKRDKTAESRANKLADLLKRLQKQIIDLEEQGEELRLKNETETTEKITAVNEHKRDRVLALLKEEEDANRRKGLLTEEVEKKYGQIRELIEQNTNININNQRQDFLIKQLQQYSEYQIQLKQLELSDAQKILGVPGTDNLADRRRVAQLQTSIALEESTVRYHKQVEVAQKAGQDTTDLTKLYLLEQQAIEEEGYRKELDEAAKYYEAQKKLIDDFGDYVLSLSLRQINERQQTVNDGYDKGLFQYYRYTKAYNKATLDARQEANRIAQETKQNEITNAQTEQNGILNNPNATPQDYQASASKVEKLKSELQQLQKEGRDTEHDILKLRTAEIMATVDLYEQLATTVVASLNTIYAAQQQSLDREIQIREQRVTYATRLAERGNTELLKVEEDRLRAAQQQRELYARRQQEVNSALAVSEAVVAVAHAAADGDPYTIAARIIALIASLGAGYAAVTASTNNAASTGFYVGGYTGDGDPRSVAGVVHKKEFVMPADKTAQNRPLLEAMREGRALNLSMLSPNLKLSDPSGAQFGDIRKLEKQMTEMTEAVKQLQSPGVNIDRSGVAVITLEHQNSERRRWKA